jgi:outer membrane protein assembly factor BamB
MRFLTTIALAMAIFHCCKGEDWPQWQGPTLNNFAHEQEWSLEDAKIRWKANVGIGYSSVVVSNGKAYTMGHNGKREGGFETVYCLDAMSGDQIWADSYEADPVDYLHKGGPCATPCVKGDNLFTLSKDGRLKCFEAANGKVIWERDMLVASGMNQPPEYGFVASPRVINDRLIVEAGKTYALRPESGITDWVSKDYKPAYGTPAPFKHKTRKFLATLKMDGIVILDSMNGQTQATYEWLTSYRTNATTLVPLSNSRLFLSTGYKRGCAVFELREGALATEDKSLRTVWENTKLCNHMNQSIVFEGYVYGFDGNAHMPQPKSLVCLDLDTGEEMWRAGQELVCGSLIASGRRFILLGERGQLLEAPISPKEFKPTHEIHALGQRCWTPPSLANGMIYARNDKGDVVCVDARAK